LPALVPTAETFPGTGGGQGEGYHGRRAAAVPVLQVERG